jgi:hypothetical protein
MELPDEASTLLISAISLATLFIAYRLLRSDPEAPIPYHVAPPEQALPGWKGEVLENPGLKVCCGFPLL